MRRLALGLGLLVLLSGFAALALALAMLQRQPTTPLQAEIAPADLARVLWLMRVHDPRRAPTLSRRRVVLSERDLALLLGHGARRWLPAGAQVELQRGAARLRLSLQVPQRGWLRLAHAWGPWLNLELDLRQQPGLPSLAAARLGAVPVPSPWVEPLARRVLALAGWQAEWALASEVVQQVRFEPGQLTMQYNWQPDSAHRVLGLWLPQTEQTRLRAYQTRLSEVVTREAQGWELPLARLLPPLFDLARERSSAGGQADDSRGDAAAEARAALLVLTLYVNGRGVHSLVPAAREWPRARATQVLLGGRADLPQHFLISAALALEASDALSRAAGLHKEMRDARVGSGFSFSDMAANRAGTRFGMALMSDPQRLLTRLAQGLEDHDLLPPLTDLPDFLPQATFERRYGGVGGEGYNALLSDIDRRLDALPLLR